MDDYGMGCSCNGLSGIGDSQTNIDFYGWNNVGGYPIAGQSTDPGAISTGYSWSDVFKQGALTGFGVFGSKFGGVQPGQYYQNGGNIAYALPQGSTQFGFSNFPGTTGVGGGSLLVYGGLAIAALVAFKAVAGK